MSDELAQTSSEQPVIAFLDHSAQISGAEINLLKVISGLKTFRPVVILGEDGPLVRELLQAGVETHVVRLPAPLNSHRSADSAVTWRSVSAITGMVRYLRELIAKLRSVSPSLIYTNSAKAHLYGGLVGRLLRVPVVIHLHDRLSSDLISRSGISMLRFAITRLSSRVIANSHGTADTIPVKAMRAKGMVLACPVVPPAASKDEYSSGEVFVFALVGRMAPWKGQLLAVRAFRKARAQIPIPSVLNIIGGPLFGERDYAVEVESEILKLGMQGAVHLLGHVSPEGAQQLMVKADVLIHTSIVPEPFGQVVVEGMALGIPVLAADEGGPAEIIRPGRDGLLYRMGDEADLAQKMIELANSAELRSRLGTEAKFAVRRYFVTPIVEELEAALRETIEARVVQMRTGSSS